MASTIEQAKLIERLIEDEADRIDDLFEHHKQMVYNRIVRLLNMPKNRLDTFPSGQIKPTGENIVKINRIILLATNKILPQYMITGIEDISKAYQEIEKANNNYFHSIVTNFKSKPVYRAITKAAIDETMYFQDPRNMARSLQEPIRNVLTEYVTTGGDIAHLVDTLQRGILNKPGHDRKSTRQAEKRLISGFRPYHRNRRLVHDSLFIYARNFSRIVSNDNGFEFYRYSGGTVKDSRPFCMHHTGHVYHVSEIEALPDKPAIKGFRYKKDGGWDGRRDGTNSTTIFTYVGGWGCRHHLIPVAWQAVPERDRARMRSKGVWNYD